MKIKKKKKKLNPELKCKHSILGRLQEHMTSPGLLKKSTAIQFAGMDEASPLTEVDDG